MKSPRSSGGSSCFRYVADVRRERRRYRPAGDGRLAGTTETFSAPGSVSTTRTTENHYLGERLDRASVATTAADGSTVPDAHRQIRYGYDIFGSLLTIKTAKTSDQAPADEEFDTTTQYTYDSFERLLSSRDDQDDDGGADGDHEVYCYDALDRRDRRLTGIGNVSNDDPDSFDAQRTACRTPPSGSAALDYSYLGLGEQLTRENTATGKGPRTYDYTPDGMRLGQRAKATTSAAAKFRPYDNDAQGSVIALEDPDRSESTPTDDDGDPAPEPQDRYQLDPYGDTANENTLAPTAKDNPFRYQSHYLDAATGTYDMQARAYRPSLGRFLTQDRFEDPTADLTLQQDPLTNNRYAFLAGNPTTSREYNGHYNCGPSIERGPCASLTPKEREAIDERARQHYHATNPTPRPANLGAPRVARAQPTRDCVLGFCGSVASAINGFGSTVGSTVTGAVKLAPCINPMTVVPALVGSSTCRDALNPFKAIPAMAEGLVDAVKTCGKGVTGHAREAGSCLAIAVELAVLRGAGRAVPRTSGAPRARSNGHERGQTVAYGAQSPRTYTVAFETQLPAHLHGRSHDVQERASNKALREALDSDPAFAAGMERVIPGINQAVSRTGGTATPEGWTWHHTLTEHAGGRVGVMRMTRRSEHYPGSPFDPLFHPGGFGGYSQWARPAGAPPR